MHNEGDAKSEWYIISDDQQQYVPERERRCCLEAAVFGSFDGILIGASIVDGAVLRFELFAGMVDDIKVMCICIFEGVQQWDKKGLA